MKVGDVVLGRGGQWDGKQLLLLKESGRSWYVRCLEKTDGPVMGTLAGAEGWYNFEAMPKVRRRKSKRRKVAAKRKSVVTEEG